jgi:hypothetical protein
LNGRSLTAALFFSAAVLLLYLQLGQVKTQLAQANGTLDAWTPLITNDLRHLDRISNDVAVLKDNLADLEVDVDRIQQGME